MRLGEILGVACALASCARGPAPPVRALLRPPASASPPAPSPPPVIPSDFSVVASGHLADVGVSLLDGATFVRCGTHADDRPRSSNKSEAVTSKPAPYYSESKVERLRDDGTLDPIGATTAIRVFGRWPDDAWREDDSTGERGHFNQRYAKWKDDRWEAVDPRGPKKPGHWSNALGIFPWGNAWLIVGKPWGPETSPGTEPGSFRILSEQPPMCFFFQASGATKWPTPDVSAQCAPRKANDYCEAHATDYASLATGEVLAIGNFCGRVRRPIELGVWKPGRAMTSVALPFPDARAARQTPPGEPQSTFVEHARMLALGPDEIYVVGVQRSDVGQGPIGWRCSTTACTLLNVPAEVDLPTTAQRDLLVIDGAIAIHDSASVWRMKSAGAWEKERLPDAVTSVASTPSGAWATASGRLFRRASDGAWAAVPLPLHDGAPLHAERLSVRGAEVWVVAKYGTTLCDHGRALLRLGAPRAALHCVDGALRISAPTPPERRTRIIVRVANVGESASADASFANTRRELDGRAPLRGKPLVLFNDNQLAVEATDEADAARIVVALTKDARAPVPTCARASELRAVGADAGSGGTN